MTIAGLRPRLFLTLTPTRISPASAVFHFLRRHFAHCSGGSNPAAIHTWPQSGYSHFQQSQDTLTRLLQPHIQLQRTTRYILTQAIFRYNFTLSEKAWLGVFHTKNVWEELVAARRGWGEATPLDARCAWRGRGGWRVAAWVGRRGSEGGGGAPSKSECARIVAPPFVFRGASLTLWAL